MLVSVWKPSKAEFLVDTEIRGNEGWSWEPVANSDIVYHGPGWLKTEHIGCLLGVREPSRRNKSFSTESVIIFDDTESKIETIRENASEYMIFEDKVWRPCKQGLVDMLVD